MSRLDQLLARNLGISRSQALSAFRAGVVADSSGLPLRDPKLAIALDQLPWKLRFGGKDITLSREYHQLQHKPIGVVTALRDPSHATAYDLLGEVPGRRDLRAVGRLDKDTSGLLLWTTDGALLHRVTHPRRAVPRRYQAAIDRPFAPLPPDLTLDDGHRPSIAELRSCEPAELHPALPKLPHAQFATMTLTSGRFHEVRRIFAALGSHVLALCRVAYGPLELPLDLAPGQHVPMDLSALFDGATALGPTDERDE